LARVFEVFLFLREENLLNCGLLRPNRGVREDAEADGSH